MNTNNKEYSRKTVGIACGLLFFTYATCCGYLIKPGTLKTVEPSKDVYSSSNYTSNIPIREQRPHKVIKSIRVLPTTRTYEVSRWVTSGDWSHDRDELTVTISDPEEVVIDLDYVDEHWDDFISDPEDEIAYPDDMFQ